MSFFKPAVSTALICLAAAVAVAQPIVLTGKVVDADNAPIHNAVVMVKAGGNLIASARALTDANGNIGTFTSSPVAPDPQSGGPVYLVVRKAGYLPKTDELGFGGGTGGSGYDVGNITLTRDPIERRIDSVMALMNLAEKIGQMTQPELGSGGSMSGTVNVPNSGTSYLYGSVLNGGSGYTSTFLNTVNTTLNTWPAGRARIPTYYGKDAVHGNAGISGYTVFPHNIGLGATRDSALVRRIGEATAKQLWAANIDLNFSPAISVARDPRWGRTYESYGEHPELHVQMGAAMVRGLQGDRYDAAWRITATAKHYLGDGGTANGKDRGNTTASDEVLRAIHLPGYEAVVEQGVLSIMASFNTINGVHQHIDSVRMTGWLKTELGFDGYIISDWQGIANSNNPGFTGCDYSDLTCTSPALTADAVRKAVNAGIDLAMEPGTHASFITHLTSLVNSGAVSQARIDDAVRRILRAKFRAGRMDNAAGPTGFAGNTANRASAEQRAIAREAVRKSQVLLKSANSALPISKTAKIHVFGTHYNNIGYQCGGWTISWQGVNGNSSSGGMGGTAFDFTSYGTSIQQGMQSVASGASITASASAPTTTDADVIVYVTGERPYAEWNGDSASLAFNPSSAVTSLNNFRNQGKKTVTVFVTGRPRIVPQLIEASDAFIVAWLPGTEGGGVADMLFGDHEFTGRLPMTWPGASGTQFEYGFGLKTDGSTSVACRDKVIPASVQQTEAAVIAPVTAEASEFTAGPNPAAKSGESISFFYRGKQISDGTLTIYDATGNVVRKLPISDNAPLSTPSPNRRAVGGWDLRDAKGRQVSNGTYLARGTITTADRKREKVSAVVGVR